MTPRCSFGKIRPATTGFSQSRRSGNRQTLRAELPCRRVTFSLDQPADVCVKQDQVWLFDQPLFALSDLHLPGRHNLQKRNGGRSDGGQAGRGRGSDPRRHPRVQGRRASDRIRGGNPRGAVLATIPRGPMLTRRRSLWKAFEKPVILLAGAMIKRPASTV